MKRLLILGVLLSLFNLSCARVKVEGSKEPIKLDIAMRVDIYQHVQKDIDAIENIVSGNKQEANTSDKQSLMRIFISQAFAQEDIDSAIEQAALRRKERRSELELLEQKGAVGENKSGLVEIRDKTAADSSTERMVDEENADRMQIYKALAQKNGVAVEQIQKMYASRLQQDAPAGAPVESLNETSGAYEWRIK